MTLFIREDGERFLLGDGHYEFKDGQLMFSADDMQSDIIEVQGDDGYLFAGQVKRPTTQEFKGYIGDFTLDKQTTEQKRRDFISFFKKNTYYKAVYILPSGEAIARDRGFLVENPEVKEIWQKSPEYSIALNFESTNYYKYREDNNGNEIYGNSINVPLEILGEGGRVWLASGAEWTT